MPDSSPALSLLAAASARRGDISEQEAPRANARPKEGDGGLFARLGGVARAYIFPFTSQHHPASQAVLVHGCRARRGLHPRWRELSKGAAALPELQASS